MKVADVQKLSPEERFLYWIRERHNIYLRRQSGKPKPWTDDEILQHYFFTNPYRENDRVTVWFRENIREPLRYDPSVIFATIAFRWFNLPETGQRLWDAGLLQDWDQRKALKLLQPVRDRGEKLFTGAYMINSPGGESKLEAILRRITNVWNYFPELCRGFRENEQPSMEDVHGWLTTYDGLGGFMAYEIVCDLRYTIWLEDAPDKLTWCNPGPGAVRGLYRILGREFKKGNNASSPPVPKDWAEQTQSLLTKVQNKLRDMPPFEMREIEMSLCEVDKYERLLWGDGRSKRKYNGVS